jgi:hypothetical protein
MVAMNRSAWLLVLLLVGCARSPLQPAGGSATETASGSVTIDGVKATGSSSSSARSSDNYAYPYGDPLVLQVELDPSTGSSYLFELGFNAASDNGMFGLSATDANVVLNVVDSASITNVVYSGTWTWCPPIAGPCTAPAGAYVGDANGSAVFTSIGQDSGDHDTGTFDLTLSWQDSSGTSHNAIASVNFDVQIILAPL